jgi:hypothetical protein
MGRGVGRPVGLGAPLFQQTLTLAIISPLFRSIMQIGIENILVVRLVT